MLIILSHLNVGFRVSPPLDPRRKPALWLMRRGVLTLGEIGQELHVSRQRVRYWAEQSGFDWHARRQKFVRKVVQQAMKARGR
jgi:DNA-directed RNA polymerase sigma subunit (sigma70/sigma32)